MTEFDTPNFSLDLSGQVSVIAWKLIYHDFSSTEESLSYGDEVDFQLTYKSPWKQAFIIRGAFYNADEFSVDTSKVWLLTAWKF